MSKNARKIAQDIFGEDNVTVIPNSKKYKLDSELEIKKKTIIMSQEFIKSGL